MNKWDDTLRVGNKQGNFSGKFEQRLNYVMIITQGCFVAAEQHAGFFV